MRRSSWILCLCLFLAVLMLAGCRQTQVPEEETPVVEEAQPEEPSVPGETPREEPEPGVEPEEPSAGIIIGNLAPNFTLENEKQEEITLKTFESRPMLLTFWVSWNEDSLKQLKVFENLYPLVQDQVGMIGVHVSAFDGLSTEELLQVIEDGGYSFDMLIDQEAVVQQLYYVGSFPATFVLDQERRLVHTYTSLVEEDQLLTVLEEILEER